MKKTTGKKQNFRWQGVFLCSLLLWCFSGSLSVKAAEEAAVVSISDGQKLTTLQDKNHRTRLLFKAGAVFAVEQARQVTGIYIIWDKLPGEWTLRVDGEEYSCGMQGFLHEYIPIDTSYEKIEAVVPKDIEICEFHVFENGEIPEWVQVWEPPLEEADMLLIPTHADDEILFFGPILPTYTEAGYSLQIAYLTNHWQSHVRPHELLNGLWTSGIRAYPVIGEFEDIYSPNLEHAETLYDKEDVLGYFVELFRRFKPKVVIGHDIGGEYGHGVHMLNADMLMQALEISADEAYYSESAKEYGVWDVPKTYLHLYKEGMLEFEWDTPLEGFDGLTAFEIAQNAFKCHKSQEAYFEVTRKKNVYGCTQFGLYRSLVGEDIFCDDFFENIDFDRYGPKAPWMEIRDKLLMWWQNLLYG